MVTRRAGFALLVGLVLALVALTPATTHAAAGDARVRVVHASPDAPAVDVYVNGAPAFKGATFFGVTDYAALPPASYKVDVFAASANGSGTPAVSVPALALAGNTDYTAVAYGLLNGSPALTVLPFVDDNTAPAAGMARVRFIHASPDAPAVDVAVTNGPVLFSNVASSKSGGYVSVAAGTYDLEVRVVGTSTVALKVPGVKVAAGTVYTVYATGLLKGTGAQALAAKVSVDSVATSTLPGMPSTGAGTMAADSSTPLLLVALAAAFLCLAAGGVVVARTRRA